MQISRPPHAETPVAEGSSVVFEITDFGGESVIRRLTLKTGESEPSKDQRRVRRMSCRLIGLGYQMSWRTLGGAHGTQGTVRMAPSAGRLRRRF